MELGRFLLLSYILQLQMSTFFTLRKGNFAKVPNVTPKIKKKVVEYEAEKKI